MVKKILNMRQITLVILVICSFLAGAFWAKGLDDKITAEMVNQAQKLIGLGFTPAETDSMLDGLNRLRDNYTAMRKIELSNETAPSLIFNPLPPNFKVETGKNILELGKITGLSLPKNREDLAFYSVRQLAELIRTKQISSVELTNFFIERLKKYDPQLKCVITLTEDLALQQAQKADNELKQGKYRGYLHGIPYGAKDLLAVKNYKTTWGAEPYQNQQLNYDATVIQKLDEAGAVLVAKLTLGALAWGDVWFGGMTRNPWNLEQGSSGSSAGSASAVSAGLLPFAIGTETLGSIVSPSTVCGVTGLRPTFGRVSRYGAMALSWSMDKIGPIARTAEDCAIVFHSIIGTDGKDLAGIEASFNYSARKSYKKLKVGYLKKNFQTKYAFQNQDSLALEKLKAMGIELIPIDLPEYTDISFILRAEAAAAFDDLTRNNQDDLLKRQIKQAWPNFFRMSRFIPAVEYINANRIRSLLIQQMHELMQKVDVIVAPSWQGTTLTMTNLTGHPCLVLPNGFNQNGTPTSISFVGKLFGEADLITIGKAFQDNSDFHQKHPKGF
jgi:Asp-tRNA(Asn)/Glu-tRNA(Gln) amidotransferase A subunit family amidase